MQCRHNEINKQVRRMTSQALCRCVGNIPITYDKNKAKADIPTHSLNNIYEAQINTTLAYEKRIIWGGIW